MQCSPNESPESELTLVKDDYIIVAGTIDEVISILAIIFVDYIILVLFRHKKHLFVNKLN